LRSMLDRPTVGDGSVAAYRVRQCSMSPEERIDVMRCDQPDLMTVLRRFRCPVMRARAGIHCHKAWRLLGHQPGELRPRQLLLENEGPIRRRTVHLEHVLCQVDADEANLSHGYHCGSVWRVRHPPRLHF
jgi:hypothetical protein